MNKIFNLSILALLLLVVKPLSAQTTTLVPGYIKKNGTYVAPYYKTTQNKTKADNFSTKPNINPYTGKEGRVVNPNPYLIAPQPIIYTPPAKSTLPPANSSEAEATQCLGTTKSGNPCRRMTKDPSGFCYQHQ
jgi:hypothetical protein